ncbi:MAG: phosphoribosyltransferase [Pleomorphochaeta sp.]
MEIGSCWKDYAEVNSLLFDVNLEVKMFYCFDYYPWAILKEIDRNHYTDNMKKSIMMMDFKIKPEDCKNNLSKKIDKEIAIEYFKNKLLQNDFDNTTIFVAAPSLSISSESYDNRFELLFKGFDNVIFLEAQKSVRSSHKSIDNRRRAPEIYENIKLPNSCPNKISKNVILIDDIFTNGDTLKGTLQFLKENFPKIENVTALFFGITKHEL